METNAFAQQVADAGSRQIVIGDKTYGIQLLPATAGLQLGNRLIKGFAPTLGVFLDNEENTEFSLEQTLFTDAAIALTRHMDDMDVVAIIKGMLAGLTCNAKPVEFDQEFRGNYGTLMAIVEFALKENFSDFFTDYLKAKGLDTETLRSLMVRKADTPEKSDSE